MTPMAPNWNHSTILVSRARWIFFGPLGNPWGGQFGKNWVFCLIENVENGRCLLFLQKWTKMAKKRSKTCKKPFSNWKLAENEALKWFFGVFRPKYGKFLKFFLKIFGFRALPRARYGFFRVSRGTSTFIRISALPSMRKIQNPLVTLGATTV